eukprot:scaffold58887_cov45-Phaeocystis_antarctica.AAC.1
MHGHTTKTYAMLQHDEHSPQTKATLTSKTGAPTRQALPPEEGYAHQVQGRPSAQVSRRLLRPEQRRRRTPVAGAAFIGSPIVRVLCGASDP